MSPARRKKSSSTPSPAKNKASVKEDQKPSSTPASPAAKDKKPPTAKEEHSEGTVTGTETSGGAKAEETAKDTPKEPEEAVEAYGTDPKKHERLRKYLLKLVEDMSNPKYTKELFPFKFGDMVRVLTLAKNIFYHEPVMIECRMPIAVVGDIHGQYNDLMHVFAMFDADGRPGCFNQRFVFLGDYVDRGKQSVECIMFVLVLKILFPGEYILLRGNHELRPINSNYGFMFELGDRFPTKARELFSYFNDVFSYMPLCCIAGNAILCMHGGICPEMTSREVFKGIPKPLLQAKHHIIAESLLWADPMYGEPRARPNYIRGLAVHFGEALIDEVCQNLGVSMIVRGHQMMLNGFKFFHGAKLVTVFTASNYYPGKVNHGAVMTVDVTGRIGFKVIIPVKNGEKKVFRGEYDNMNENDVDNYQTHPDILKARREAKWKAEQEEMEREKEAERQKNEIERNKALTGKKKKK